MSDLERIISALDENKIPYNKKFPKVRKLGYGSDECQKLSEKIIDLVENLTVVAINKGNSDINAAIKDLTDIAVLQSESKAARKVKQNAAMVKITIDELDKHKRRELKVNIKQKTVEYIDNAINAIEIVKNSAARTDSIKYNMQSAIEKLQTLKANVSDVWDESSKQAADYMGKILLRVKGVIGKVSSYSCDLEGLLYIDEAIQLSESWKNLNSAATGRNKASEDYIKTNWEKGNDHGKVELIKNSVYVLDKIHLFVGDLEAYREETKRLCNTEKLEGKIAEREEKIARLQSAAESAAIKYRNGEITEQKTMEILQKCKKEKAEESNLLTTDKNRLAQMEGMRKARDRHADECGNLTDQFLYYENSPVMLAAIASSGEINFDEIRSLIMGNLNSAKAQEVINTISVNLRAIADRIQTTIGEAGEWDTVNTDLYQDLHINETTSQTNESMEDLLKDLGIDLEEKKEEKVKEDQVINGTITLNENER